MVKKATAQLKLRMPRELHGRLVATAAAASLSLNALVIKRLEESTNGTPDLDLEIIVRWISQKREQHVVDGKLLRKLDGLLATAPRRAKMSAP